MKRALPLIFLFLPCFANAQAEAPQKYLFGAGGGYSLFYTNLGALRNDTLLSVPGNASAGYGFRYSLGRRESWTGALSIDGGWRKKNNPYTYYNSPSQTEFTAHVPSQFNWLRFSLDAYRNVYTKGRFSIVPYAGIAYTFSRLRTSVPVNPILGTWDEREYRMKQPVGLSLGVMLERLHKGERQRPSSFSLRMGTTIPLTKTYWKLNGQKAGNAPKAWLLPVGITLLVNVY